MGYYTCYNLDAKRVDGANLTEAVIDSITDWLRERDVLLYALSEPYYNTKNPAIASWPEFDSVKWYEHDDDMVALSKQFPDVVFCLHGDGDDSRDLWETYYQNGEYEVCTVEINMPNPQTIKW